MSSPAPTTPAPRGLPRPLEALAALLGLLLCAPLLFLIALAVRLGSAGPALFRQTRIGRHGRPFVLYKFRSMTIDTPGSAVTAADDRRVTPVGRLLRRSKLDELPALWNVLAGDLSLVGPRPEVPRYVDLEDPRWQRVLAVRPGLTDPVTLRLRNEEALLATVEGDRDAFYRHHLLPYKLRGAHDYLAQRSAWTDLVVLARTALAILRPQQAPPPSREEIEAVSEQETA